MGLGSLFSNKSISPTSISNETVTQTSSGVFEVSGGLGGGDVTVVQYGNGVTVEGLSDTNLKLVTDATTNLVDKSADLSGQILEFADRTAVSVMDYSSDAVKSLADAFTSASKTQNQTTAAAMEQVATAWGRANSDTQANLDAIRPILAGVFLLGGVAIVASVASIVLKK